MSGAPMNSFGLWVDRYLVPVAVALSLVLSVTTAVEAYIVGTLLNPAAAASVAAMLALSAASLALIPKHISRRGPYTDFVKLLLSTCLAIYINAAPGLVIPDYPSLPLWVRIVFALLPVAHAAHMMKLDEKLKHRIDRVASKRI